MSDVSSKEEYFLFGNWDSAGGGLSLLNGKVIFSLVTLDEYIYKSFSSNYILEVNTWYTIVGTYDGSSLELYVNGEKLTWNSSNPTPSWVLGSTNIGSGNVASSLVDIAINTNLDFGNPDTNRGNANATYSDALIFTRALSASEISTDYSDVPNPTNKDNLLLYYDFKR